MKSFRRFALWALIAAYILIFVGGLVRVSGAGLGCPDWPTCFGRWIPPTSVSQLPPDIDPASFNFTLAWMEYINRLIGIVVGLLITIMTISAIKNFRKTPRIIIPSIITFLLVAYQVWQGGQVVTSQLQPFIVSIHMVVALIIVGLLVYINQQTYYIAHPDADAMVIFPAKSGAWVHALWIALVFQIILGTHVRSVLVPEQGPIQTASLGLGGPLAAIDFLHPLLGLIIAIYTWLFGLSLLKRGQNLSGLLKKFTVAMMILMLIQIIVGGVLITTGVPGFVQIFHLWIASFYIGILIYIHSAYNKTRRLANAKAQ